VELDDLQERVAALERNAWGGNPPVIEGKANDEESEP
jgi:hypothetical protein